MRSRLIYDTKYYLLSVIGIIFVHTREHLREISIKEGRKEGEREKERERENKNRKEREKRKKRKGEKRKEERRDMTSRNETRRDDKNQPETNKVLIIAPFPSGVIILCAVHLASRHPLVFHLPRCRQGDARTNIITPRQNTIKSYQLSKAGPCTPSSLAKERPQQPELSINHAFVTLPARLIIPLTLLPTLYLVLVLVLVLVLILVSPSILYFLLILSFPSFLPSSLKKVTVLPLIAFTFLPAFLPYFFYYIFRPLLPSQFYSSL